MSLITTEAPSVKFKHGSKPSRLFLTDFYKSSLDTLYSRTYAIRVLVDGCQQPSQAWHQGKKQGKRESTPDTIFIVIDALFDRLPLLFYFSLSFMLSISPLGVAMLCSLLYITVHTVPFWKHLSKYICLAFKKPINLKNVLIQTSIKCIRSWCIEQSFRTGPVCSSAQWNMFFRRHSTRGCSSASARRQSGQNPHTAWRNDTG